MQSVKKIPPIGGTNLIFVMENSSIPTPTGTTPIPSPTPIPTPTPTPTPAPTPSGHTDQSIHEPAHQPEHNSTNTDNNSEDPTESTEKCNLLDVPPALIIACSAAFGIAGPFILWAIWKDKSDELKETAKSVLNTQLSWHLWIILTFSLLPIHPSFAIITLAAIIGWIYITAKQIIEFSNKNYDYTPPLSITLF